MRSIARGVQYMYCAPSMLFRGRGCTNIACPETSGGASVSSTSMAAIMRIVISARALRSAQVRY